MLYFVTNYLLYVTIWIGMIGIPFEPIGIFWTIIAPGFNLFIAYKLQLLPKIVAFKINAVSYFFWLLKEIFNSSIYTIKLGLARYQNIGVFEEISQNQKNPIGVATYASSITLTPGTITIFIKPNKFLVHALTQELIEDLKTGAMQQKVQNIIK